MPKIKCCAILQFEVTEYNTVFYLSETIICMLNITLKLLEQKDKKSLESNAISSYFLL